MAERTLTVQFIGKPKGDVPANPRLVFKQREAKEKIQELERQGFRVRYSFTGGMLKSPSRVEVDKEYISSKEKLKGKIADTEFREAKVEKVAQGFSTKEEGSTKLPEEVIRSRPQQSIEVKGVKSYEMESSAERKLRVASEKTREFLTPGFVENYRAQKSDPFLAKAVKSGVESIVTLPADVVAGAINVPRAGLMARRLLPQEEPRNVLVSSTGTATKTLFTKEGGKQIIKEVTSPELIGSTLAFVGVAKGAQLAFKATPLYQPKPYRPLRRGSRSDQLKGVGKLDKPVSTPKMGEEVFLRGGEEVFMKRVPAKADQGIIEGLTIKIGGKKGGQFQQMTGREFYSATSAPPRKLKFVDPEIGRKGASADRRAFHEYNFYFSEDQIASQFGTRAVLRYRTKVSSFDESLMKRIKQGEIGPNLRRDLQANVEANPGKLYPGTKTSSGMGSEIEFVEAPYSDFYFSKVRFFTGSPKPQKNIPLRNKKDVKDFGSALFNPQRQIRPLRDVRFDRPFTLKEEFNLLKEAGRDYVKRVKSTIPKGKKATQRRPEFNFGLPSGRLLGLGVFRQTLTDPGRLRPTEVRKKPTRSRPDKTPPRDRDDPFIKIPPPPTRRGGDDPFRFRIDIPRPRVPGTSPPRVPGTPPITLPPPTVPDKFFKFDQVDPFKKIKPTEKRRTKQKKKYTPSVVGIEQFFARGVGLKKAPKGRIGGIGIRPVVLGKL